MGIQFFDGIFSYSHVCGRNNCRLDAILAYEELTEEEKAAIDKEWMIENLKERVAEELQTDSKSGICAVRFSCP